MSTCSRVQAQIRNAFSVETPQTQMQTGRATLWQTPAKQAIMAVCMRAIAAFQVMSIYTKPLYRKGVEEIASVTAQKPSSPNAG